MDRPILFSGPMVRALLAGTKTQTRRVVKGVNPDFRFDGFITEGPKGYAGKCVWSPKSNHQYCTTGGVKVACPYGQPGDRLWVREKIALTDMGPSRYKGFSSCVDVTYGADGEMRWIDLTKEQDEKINRLGARPSIHMPRWASRLTLEVTGVRVERLQDISEEDAKAEGLLGPHPFSGEWSGGDIDEAGRPRWYASPIQAFRSLWESINGPGSWGANPWVWVVEFKRVTP